MKRLLLGISLLLFVAVVYAQGYDASAVRLSKEEMELYELVMAYRAEKGLPRIAISPALTYVAQVHAKDVYEHFDEIPSGCNPHSWSNHGTWSRCDYYPDHRNASRMWSKPRELTDYQGNGYEIANYYNPPTSGTCTPIEALRGWQNSPGHNAVMINLSPWDSHPWGAIGIGMYKGVATIWFGEETDIHSMAKVTPTKAEVKTNEPAETVVTIVKKEEEPKETKVISKTSKERPSGGLISRYYGHSGKISVSWIGAGYTYSCKSREHLLSAELLNLRTGLFGLSLLDFEMGVAPNISPWFAYRPSAKFYIPTCKWLSVCLYGGAETDITYLGQYFLPDYTWNKEDNYFLNAFGGLGLHLTGLRWMPIDLNVEYRHPIINTIQPQGVYLSAKLYLATTWKRS